MAQRSCLCPLFYSLFSDDYVAKYDNNSNIKFTEDTTVILLISDSDERACRREVEELTIWFTSEASKNNPTSIFINCHLLKLLISWYTHLRRPYMVSQNQMATKGHQRLYFSDVSQEFWQAYKCFCEPLSQHHRECTARLDHDVVWQLDCTGLHIAPKNMAYSYSLFGKG